MGLKTKVNFADRTPLCAHIYISLCESLSFAGLVVHHASSWDQRLSSYHREHSQQMTRPANNNLHVYARWCAIKVRLDLKTHNNVTEYLLNTAELLDNEPTLRYATDKAWDVDFNCFS